MELDDFKIEFRNKNDIALPGNHFTNEQIDNLIGTYKAYHEKQKKKTRLFSIVYFALASLYLAKLATERGYVALGYLVLGIGFIASVLYVFFRYKSFSSDAYSLSVKEFLNLAEKKVRYLTFKDYIIIVPLLVLFGTGGGLIFTGSLLRYTDNSTLLIFIWVTFFVSLCLFGFWAGKKGWQKESEELYERLVEMRETCFLEENDKI